MRLLFIKRPDGVNNNALLHVLLYPEVEATIRDLQRAELPDHYTCILNQQHPMKGALGLN